MSKRPSPGKLVPRNPLAVVALFVSAIDAIFAYPVTKLAGINQTIIIAFMVVFPSALMVFFFLTVWFRPAHLYGPGDFTKDENFLRGIRATSALPTVRTPVFVRAEEQVLMEADSAEAAQDFSDEVPSETEVGRS